MLTEPEQLSPATQVLLLNPENEVFVSVASYWELKIKAQLGKFELPPELLVESKSQGIQFLDFSMESVETLEALPPIHGDPFDRAIIAHSIEHKLALVTADKVVQKYSTCAKIISD